MGVGRVNQAIESLLAVRRRVALSGFAITGLGFLLARFTVTLAVADSPMEFVLAGVGPLVIGLALSAVGIALAVGYRLACRWLTPASSP